MEMTRTGKRRVATVGTFDGLHRGHRRVLSLLEATARERGLEPMVVCFDRHPLETIAPERAPGLVQDPRERDHSLHGEGLDVLILEFTPTLARLTARDWLRKMHEEEGVDVLIVGYDNTFGSDGIRMDIADYRRLGSEVGVEVVEAPYEPHASSSAIRRLLREGSLDEANHLLGRPFSLRGTVVEGKHLGRRLGFPTANVEPPYRALLPKAGVYEVEVNTDTMTHRGVANVGRQPTVGPDEPERVEVYIPGFEGDLYGSDLTVRFLRRLRDERQFASLEDLKAQIRHDVEKIDSISKITY